MAINQIKRYSEFLDITHFSPADRTRSLIAIVDRDIADNLGFYFRTKIIRPIKKEGVIDMESLFSHLTHQSEEEKDEKGAITKKRNVFDFDRSKRLHWIWHHIQEKSKANIEIFSYNDRIRGKNVIRTYVYDFVEKYVIILEPQRSQLDYYLLTAYYLTEKLGGVKQMESKRKNKLPLVY